VTALVTLPCIPLIEVGIEYPLSTGPASFTTQDLQGYITSLNDPAIKAPRVKLGHDGPLNDTSAEPAFGTFQNMHLSADGMTLYADAVGLPEWLALVLPSAYPNRSIEGSFAPKTTATGKTWQLSITAVSFLGVVLPGISTLDDLEPYYGSIMPEGVIVVANAKESKESKEIKAQINVADLSRSFYDTVATGEQFWWWLREMYLDPNEAIAENDDGSQLYSIPFTINGEEVTWGDPAPIKIQYIPDPKGEEAPNSGLAAAQISYLTLNSSEPAPVRVAVAAAVFSEATKPRREARKEMDLATIREALGMEASASEADVLARAKALAAETESADEEDEDAENGEGDGDGESESDAPDTTETGQPIPPITGPPGSEGTGEGTVTVDAAVWEQTRRDAKNGADARAKQISDERESLVMAAVSDGRIPPARAKHWRKQLDADPGAAAVLASLQKGLIPMAAVGNNPAPEELTGQGGAIYPVEWLSAQERQRLGR
jgi:hypothetical protein